VYLDLAIFAVFILIYSSVAGAVERTWISGAIIFTAFGILIGPVGLDLISFLKSTAIISCKRASTSM
jgi:hypothetical protein